LQTNPASSFPFSYTLSIPSTLFKSPTMKAFLVTTIALVVGVVAADNSYIPSDISAGCSSFLNNLNDDSSLNQCTMSLLTATKAYSGSTNATSSDLSSTLSNLCSDTQCSNPSTRGLLTQFWSACTNELSGGSTNSQVRLLYDILYFFIPFRAAVCATNSATGNYCVNSLGSTTPAGSKRDTLEARGSDPVVDPNALRKTGMPYLFMLPSSSPSQLCTPCGKAVLQAYVTWEATLPYGFGLSQSPILGGQPDLWAAVKSKCGQSFISAITADAKAAPLAALSGAPALRTPVLTTLVGLAGLSAVALL